AGSAAPVAPVAPAASAAQGAKAAAAAAKPSASAAKPAPRASKPAADVGDDDAKAARSRDVMREKELLKKKQQQVIMYAWIVAGGAAVLALGMWLFAKRTDDQRKQEAADLAARQEKVLTDARAMDASTEEGLTKIIEFLTADEERKKLWATSPQGPEIQTLLSKAVQEREAKRERRALKEAFEDLRNKLANPASMSVEQIREMRITLVNQIEPKASGSMDTQFATDVAQLKQNTDRVYAAKLHEEARSAANAANDVAGRQAALKKYTEAEDEIVKLFEESLKKNQSELSKYYEGHFREVIDESDLLAKAIFTPDFVEKQPWKDLLSTDQAPNWNAASLEGFSQKFERGALTLRGPNAAARQNGVTSIGDREQFRDFVLDFEFTILKGEFELYARVGKRFDGTVESLKFSALEESPNASFLLSSNESYSGTLTFIGSSWTCELSAGDPQTVEQVKWVQSRRGGIGLLVPTEAEVKITRMRIKSLRQSGSL
ncbi:MAG: hypothetical protein L6Q99_18860, partial [Planctomycetes bacterium]|nr:hypothetical protein [Planctomycetota bacterium]